MSFTKILLNQILIVSPILERKNKTFLCKFPNNLIFFKIFSSGPLKGGIYTYFILPVNGSLIKRRKSHTKRCVKPENNFPGSSTIFGCWSKSSENN